VLGAALVSTSIVLLAVLVGRPERAPQAGAAGRGLIALSAAFLADDLVSTAAPGVPTSARSRFLTRAAFGVPMTIIAWLGLAVIESAVSAAPVLMDPLAAITMSCGALGLALAVSRRYDGPSPGAIGAGAVALLATAAAAAPPTWTARAPDQPVVVTAAATLMLISVWTSTAEPAR
jgi:hypothetical protein